MSSKFATPGNKKRLEVITFSPNCNVPHPLVSTGEETSTGVAKETTRKYWSRKFKIFDGRRYNS